VFGFFRRNKSKDDLKQRLKLVLSYDRANLTPGRMEELKRELVAVIGKYFPREGAELNVRIEQQGDKTMLIADLPAAVEGH
jgi:cell division topological specificity factor